MCAGDIQVCTKHKAAQCNILGFSPGKDIAVEE